jgi:hypothetical protein
MPTKIGPNKTEFYSGIVLLILFPVIACYGAYDLTSTLWEPYFSNQRIRDCVLIFLGLLAVVKYIKSRYSMPYQVVVDDELKTLKLKYLFQKPKVIRRDHMVSYNSTSINVSTRSGSIAYPGVYINLVDGSKVLISEQRLEDCFTSNQCWNTGH